MANNAVPASERWHRGPVDYRSVRVAYQRVRALLALGLTGLAVVAFQAELPGATIKVSVMALIATDALVRSRVRSGPVTPLVIDSLAAGAFLGFGTIAGLPLIAFGAYAVAAAITFAGTRSLAWAGIALIAGITARLTVLPAPTEITPMITILQWAEAIVCLTALALTIMAGARRMEAARHRQAAVLAAERRASEMKNEFVAMVTHELRTPLTTIAGFAITLRDGWRDLAEDEVDDFLRIMVGETEHLGNLVEDVLAIPRLEAGNLLLDVTDFQLRPSVYRIVDLLFPAHGDRSASVAIGGNVHVRADPNRVEQVLRNLLENARKYGGQQVTVEATDLGTEYQITIADNGAGVTTDDSERIFGSFEQVGQGNSRTQSGFGLGLAVARHLVEAMGGRIWYEPGFPVGARFCFTLPKSTSETAAVDSKESVVA